jgi:glycine hydroxymethyltransferase
MKTNITDPIFSLIDQERQRQESTIGLIPSENYASQAVMQAVGSVLMNKYSEGQAGARYYPGNAVIDDLERLCKECALRAFQLDGSEWGVNVQALSGSPANLAAISAVLQPGEKILSMYLADGGHLSHGWQLPNKKITLVSKIWEIAFYHVSPKTEVFDYDEIMEIAKKEQPKLIISGGTAYPREIDHAKMRAIADAVGAYYMADIAHEAGLVAGGVNISPFPYADIVTMTTHKTLRGPRGALIFAKKPLNELIDKSVFPGMQGGPHNHTIAGITVALGEALLPSFSEYTRQILLNATTMAETLTEAGLHVVSGGTDKHLILLDLRDQHISGWVVDKALERAGIIANRNTVPNETASPFYPSGLRMGTPAITTRGMHEAEAKQIAVWITQVIEHCKKQNWVLPQDKDERKKFVGSFAEITGKDEFLKALRGEVEKLCKKFPIYGKH